MTFEKLDFPLVFDSGFAGAKCAEIAPFARFRIGSARVEPVLTRR